MINVLPVEKPLSLRTKIAVGLVLFLLALLPRVFGLDIFVTSDEPLWLTRSVFFSEALLAGDFTETLQTGHPGVTTMWTGSLGLLFSYWQEQPNVSFRDYLQASPHDPARIDIEQLGWARLPTVILAAVCVVLLFWWGQQLLGQAIAMVAALLLAFDPLFLAHSRTLHHDALATIFTTLSVLALFRARFAGKAGLWFILSALFAGLSLLSKGTALFLFPFAALFLLWLWLRDDLSLGAAILAGLTWSGVAVATFTLLWPAMWVVPGQVLFTVFDWILSSADLEEVIETTSFEWAGRVPDLGVLFYPVNWLLKSTLLSVVGLLALPAWWLEPKHRGQRWVIGWFGLFMLLFAVMLTLGDKRDGRYLLPIYPGSWLLAAAGLTWLAKKLADTGSRLWQRYAPSTSAKSVRQYINVGLGVIFGLLLLSFSLPWYPYYHTYYNPLIAGNRLAPKLIKVGWGEGMEQVAAYLNRQPQARQSVVATSYEQNLLPFFVGRSTKHHHTDPSDYVLNYIRQIQNGYPFPEYWQYYQARPPVYQLQLDGIDYLWLYRDSALVRVRDAQLGDGLELMAYKLDTPLLSPGQSADLTLVWRVTDAKLKDAPVHIKLVGENDHVWGAAPPAPVLDPAAPSPVEGHYQLNIAPNAPRQTAHFSLTVAAPSQKLGPIQFGDVALRNTSLPPSAISIPPINLDNKIRLLGYQISTTTLAPDQELMVVLYWQAQTDLGFDYTVFAQLLTSEGAIKGQQDSQPVNGQLPTSQWRVGEVVPDPHPITVAADASPGQYQLLVGMYRWDTGERLPLLDEAQNPTGTAINLTTITIE